MNNLIYLILIELVSSIIICYLFKKKDISKLIIVLYLLFIWFIPIYNIKINNQNNNNYIMKEKKKFLPSDIHFPKVDMKNIFGIIIGQEEEVEIET